MSAMPWTRRPAEQPAPAGLAGGDGRDRAAPATRTDHTGHAAEPRHAGIGTQGKDERGGADMDRHQHAPADRHDPGAADRHDLGPADQHDTAIGTGTGTGIGSGIGTGIGTGTGLPIGTADRRDPGPGEWHHPADADGSADAGADAAADAHADADAVTHHIVVPHSGDRGDVVRTGTGTGTDRSARRRYPVISSVRFWNEEIRLRDLLRIVREGDYNMAHIPVVRAANTAFFWLVTAPVVTIVFLALWAFAVSLHRAVTIAGVLLIGAQAAPVVPWLVVSTWPAAVWQWAGAAALVFGVGTAIAAAVDRHR